MTESEARKRWCPMAKLVYRQGGMVLDNQSAHNRLQEATTAEVSTPPGALCIASDCACWLKDGVLNLGEANEEKVGHCGLIR